MLTLAEPIMAMDLQTYGISNANKNSNAWLNLIVELKVIPHPGNKFGENNIKNKWTWYLIR